MAPLENGGPSCRDVYKRQEHGYVYAAVPPLFKLTRGKTVRVAYDEKERDRVSAELRGDLSLIHIYISSNINSRS